MFNRKNSGVFYRYKGVNGVLLVGIMALTAFFVGIKAITAFNRKNSGVNGVFLSV